MTRGRGGIRRLFRLGLYDRWTTRRDVEEEIGLHLELRTLELIRSGMEPGAARQEAERLFASRKGTLRALHRAATRRSRRMATEARLELWLRDGRNAVRSLARDRLLSGFVVLTLGLGMGAALTSFGLVERILLSYPAHLSEPDRLVRLYGTTRGPGGEARTMWWIPYATYEALREGVGGIERMGAYRITPRTVGAGLEARTRPVGETLGGYFPMLGSRPLMGRYFTADEVDASAGRLAIVNERYWRESMSASPEAVGGVLQVDGESYTIVGVAPSAFAGTELRRVDAWILAGRSGAPNRAWQVVGRLAPGTGAEAVGSEATAVLVRTSDALPSWFRWFRDARVSARPITLSLNGTRPLEATLAGWLAVMSVLILLVALGNVTNLLLARLARRRRDLAVRLTLGSGRAGILRLLGLEGLALAAAAGALSLVVASVAGPFLRGTLLGGEAPWTFTLADARLLAALLLLVVLTALVIAAVPAAQSGGRVHMAALRSGARDGGGRGGGLRTSLTILQATLSVILLVGAGLFMISMLRVQSMNLGVDLDVLVVGADLPPDPGGAAAHEIATFERLAGRAQSLPGVESAAMTIGLPLDGGAFAADVFLAGGDSVPSLPGGGPYVSAVGPGYFETVGTGLLSGRTYTAGDAEGAEPVLIVNRTLAGTVWPDEDALGRCLRVAAADQPCARIVGIVADIHRVGLDDEPAMQLYLPARQQRLFGGAHLVVRPTARGPIAAAALRRALMAEEPSLRLVEVGPLSAALDDDLRPLRLGLASFGLSSIIALLVAAMGLYSVMAYLVAWRTHEIGIRSALGATRNQIARLVVTHGAAMAAGGIALGLALSVVLARWLEPHLFRTRAMDPAVMTTVAGTLVLVSLAAAWIPSRRAARISPSEALRVE